MKSKIFFITGIVFILISFFLIIEYPESNRLSAIAGLLTSLGIGLNVVGYLLKKELVKQ